MLSKTVATIAIMFIALFIMQCSEESNSITNSDYEYENITTNDFPREPLDKALLFCVNNRFPQLNFGGIAVGYYCRDHQTDEEISKEAAARL